jgi:coniferyl-aldehyde dehydrogenase
MTTTTISTEPNSTIASPETMRLVLDRQRAAFAEEGNPTYGVRIDRIDRLIALMIENKNEIASALIRQWFHQGSQSSLDELCMQFQRRSFGY